MRRGGYVLAVLAVVLLGLSACSSQIKGTAVVATGKTAGGGAAVTVSKPADLPYNDDTELANVYATMRTWDVCAMHDPEATKETLRTNGGSIQPYLDLSGCKMEINTENRVSWEFRIDLQKLGAVYSEKPPQKENVGGAEVFKTTDDTSGGCTYEFPYRKVAAIALEVSTYDDSEKLRVCEVAKAYLTKVLPKWQNPPLAGSGKTSPTLRMLGQDPCKGLVPFRDELAAKAIPESGLRAELQGPYDCTLTASLKDGGYEDYEIGFGMTDPEDLQEGDKIQVAGLDGVKDEYADCEYHFGFGTAPIVLSNQGTDTVDVLEVSLPDCSQAQDTLNKILGQYQDVFTRKPPQPAAGAQPLGDLNPPSTADSVGAPFDPCTVVSWADFPATMKDPKPTEPHLAKLYATDKNVQTGCTFNAEKAITTIGWGKDGLDVLLRNKDFTKGGTQQKIGGRDAIRFRESNSGDGQICTDFIKSSKGVLAVGTNQNYSKLDPCSINDQMVPKIVAKVP